MNRRALVIGYGSIGRRRCRILRDFGWQVTIWEPMTERWAAAFADGFEDCHPGGDGVRGEPATVAFVCSPPALHFEHTAACLQLGLHVFIEKPIAHRIRQAEAIVSLARNAGRLVFVGCNYRFGAAVAPADPFRVHALELRMGYNLREARPGYRDAYVNDPDQGGVCLDSGAHAIDLARHWLGPVAAFHGARPVGPQRHGMATEESAEIWLVHQSEAMSRIYLDWWGPAARSSVATLRNGPRILQELWSGTDSMFEREMRYFLRAAAGKTEDMRKWNAAADATETLRWCVYARNRIRTQLGLPAVPA